MASIYKKGNVWYLSVTSGKNRITRSLKTGVFKVAEALKPHIESQIIAELTGNNKSGKQIGFPELAERFLKAEHGWAKTTYELNRLVLRSHIAGKPFPVNPTSRAIHTRHINQCWNWGLKNHLIHKAYKIPGDTKGESRVRTYTAAELKLMFSEINDESFNAFVRFAYYTGARSGEIRRIAKENVLEGSLVVKGETGRRMVKLNGKAQEIIKHQDPLWSYRNDFEL